MEISLFHLWINSKAGMYDGGVTRISGGGIFLFAHNEHHISCYCNLEFTCSGLFVTICVWKNQ